MTELQHHLDYSEPDVHTQTGITFRLTTCRTCHAERLELIHEERKP